MDGHEKVRMDHAAVAVMFGEEKADDIKRRTFGGGVVQFRQD